jgi:phosphopantothenoylcysteine decarboxylase/phosphopantothenate--cysteine ligase
MKKILIGVTGGIAAYKAVELCSILKKSNFDIQVVMTKSAQEFITPLTFQAISGNPVLTELWDKNSNNGIDHINLSRDADLIVIAPTTANFIAKLNYGLADDLLSSICLGRNCPLLICPAMNTEMFKNPSTQRNLKQLKDDGVLIIGPEIGIQACGESGPGRMTEPEDIFQEIEKILLPPSLKDINILISAGATLEKIDDARAITNLSSGKMGIAIANQAWKLGANVTLIKAATNVVPYAKIKTINAFSHEDMQTAITKEIKKNNIFISVAAVSDYSPIQKTGKIKKHEKELQLSLTRNIDILSSVKASYPKVFCVGFAAESENIAEYAKKKLIAKNIDLIIANEIKETMGHDEAEVIILSKTQEIKFSRMPKNVLAYNILQEIHKTYKEFHGN